MSKSILVTGGTGYIGSHTTVRLLESGYDVTVLDNLSNSKKSVLDRIEQITGTAPRFYEVDLLDPDSLRTVVEESSPDAVIHFAAKKAVGESVSHPLRYYRNNVTGSQILFEVIKEHDVSDIVFSSSAAIYGEPETVPIKEDQPANPTNPYGRTKWMMEQVLNDVQTANPEWNVIALRYFNPVGAHPSGNLGEDPSGVPDNLMPYISQVATGELDQLSVFGNDYPTHDGTGVRDYIHIMDLVSGHLSALNEIENDPGFEVYNLGTGKGYSVLEVVEAYEEASGREIPYEFTDRRPGDVATLYADPSRAREELGWEAKRDLEQMCRDAWNWRQTIRSE